MDVTRRQLVERGVAVSSALLLAGCTGGGGEDRGNSIQITQQSEPAHNYDPVTGPRAFTNRISNHIFEGLYEYGEGLEVVPKLATGAPEIENDGTRYVVEIEPDAEFHNGDPVTAEDVVHSFVAPVEEQTLAMGDFSMLDLEATEPVDERTVQFELEDPYAPFESTTLTALIVNREVRLEDPAAYSSNPVGSGPFQYVDHVDGEYTDLERWDDYWDEPLPEIESVRWVATDDNAARTAQILAGDTDAIKSVPPADYERIANDDEVDVHLTPGIPYQHVTYNCNGGPTEDPDVRAGIEHLLPTTHFVEQAIGEMGILLDAPLPDPVLEEWDLPADEYAELIGDFDPERAVELLEGNVPDGWEPQLVGTAVAEPLYEQLASRLRELEDFGLEIDPNVRILDIAQFDQTAYSGDPEEVTLYSIGWTGGPDPDSYLWPMFHESAEGSNQGHYYDDEAFHERLAQARRTMDRDERRDLYDGIIREVLEETIQTPTYTTGNSIAVRSHVSDVEIHEDAAVAPRLVSAHHNVSVE